MIFDVERRGASFLQSYVFGINEHVTRAAFRSSGPMTIHCTHSDIRMRKCSLVNAARIFSKLLVRVVSPCHLILHPLASTWMSTNKTCSSADAVHDRGYSCGSHARKDVQSGARFSLK
jgi:hypothetical protein